MHYRSSIFADRQSAQSVWMRIVPTPLTAMILLAMLLTIFVFAAKMH